MSTQKSLSCPWCKAIYHFRMTSSEKVLFENLNSFPLVASEGIEQAIICGVKDLRSQIVHRNSRVEFSLRLLQRSQRSLSTLPAKAQRYPGSLESQKMMLEPCLKFTAIPGSVPCP